MCAPNQPPTQSLAGTCPQKTPLQAAHLSAWQAVSQPFEERPYARPHHPHGPHGPCTSTQDPCSCLLGGWRLANNMCVYTLLITPQRDEHASGGRPAAACHPHPLAEPTPVSATATAVRKTCQTPRPSPYTTHPSPPFPVSLTTGRLRNPLTPLTRQVAAAASRGLSSCRSCHLPLLWVDNPTPCCMAAHPPMHQAVTLWHATQALPGRPAKVDLQEKKAGPCPRHSPSSLLSTCGPAPSPSTHCLCRSEQSAQHTAAGEAPA